MYKFRFTADEVMKLMESKRKSNKVLHFQENGSKQFSISRMIMKIYQQGHAMKLS